MQDDEMTIREAAEVLGVSKFRVHAMIKQGQLQRDLRSSEVGTPYLVLKRAEVAELAEERRRMAAGELPPRGGTKPKAPPGGRP